MPQFDLYSFLPQILWLSLFFGFLYFVVKIFIIPKAETIFSSREDFLLKNIEDAKRYSSDTEQLETKYIEQLTEQDGIIDEIRKKALKEIKSHIESKKRELTIFVKEVSSDLNKDLENYEKDFLKSQEKASLDLASFIVHETTGKKLDLKLLQTK